MARMFRDSRAARWLFGLLLTLVLATRVAIPLGYMPSQASHGITLSLTLCGGMAPATTIVTIPLKAGHEQKHETPTATCFFAAGLGTGLLSAEPIELASVEPQSFEVPSVRAIADLATHRLAAPPPPAQAPPAQV